jgi:hypothetical protein
MSERAANGNLSLGPSFPVPTIVSHTIASQLTRSQLPALLVPEAWKPGSKEFGL